MSNVVERYLPEVWGKAMIVPRNSVEFSKVEKDLAKYGVQIRSLFRNEEEHLYGQFLLRQQYMAIRYGNQQVFKVRRYVGVSDDDYDSTFLSNLDPRRCPFDGNFWTNFVVNDVILIVLCLTTDQYVEPFVPTKSTDYYIEYAAHIE